MGYLLAIVIAIFVALLGKVVVSYLGIDKAKHTLVYGLFSYYAGFFILSGPFTFLSLPWNLYFITMTLYHLVLLGIIVYACMKKKIHIAFSLSAFVNYLKDNWLMLTMIIFFIVMNFASDNFEVGVAVSDDITYLSRAANNIGNNIFPLRVEEISGRLGKIDLLLFISFYELFWGYMSQLFHIDLIIFSRITMAMMTYIWFFYTVDELIYVYAEKEQYKKLKYTILAAGLLYLVHGMQSEVYKFMYNPWFGNVISLMLYLPLLLLFLKQSLNNQKAFILLCALPFIFVGFSPVSVLHAGLTILPSMLVWYQNKTYKLKYEKVIIYLAFALSLLFIAVSMVQNLKAFNFNIFFRGEEDYTKYLTDISQFKFAFNARLVFMLPGIIIFFYRLSVQKVTKFEKAIVLFALALLFVAIIPKVNVALFVLFSFPLRRVLDSYMLALVFYSFANIILILPKMTPARTLGLFAVLSVFFYQVHGFYLLDGPDEVNFNNVFLQKREQQVVSDVVDFLSEHNDQKTNVCLLPDRFYEADNGGNRVDMGIATGQLPNVYYNCNEPAGTQTFFIVRNEADLAQLAYSLDRSHVKLVKTITTEQLSVEIYQYIY